MKPLSSLSDDELLQALREAEAELPAPPAALMAAVIALAPTAPQAPRSALGSAPQGRPWLARIAAVLAFDSWAAPALAHGMRSGSPAPRHLLFSAEERDLDLRLTAGPTGHALTGQVLGPDEAGTIELVRLDAPEAAPRRAALDPLGEFGIDGLAAGTWSLTLTTAGGLRIELPPLVIGARP